MGQPIDLRSDQNEDDLNIWGEDEETHGTNDSVGDPSLLNREWKLRQDQFHTMGYREGITAGKEASAQDGFNVGFKQSVNNGYNWGLVRGMTSAFSNLPNHLKEKLASKVETRERIQNLNLSTQNISTTDALKIYHKSIQHTEVGQEVLEDDQLEKLHKELVSVLREMPELSVKIDPRKDT